MTSKAEEVQKDAILAVLAVVSKLDIAESEIGLIRPVQREEMLSSTVRAAVIGWQKHRPADGVEPFPNSSLRGTPSCVCHRWR